MSEMSYDEIKAISTKLMAMPRPGRYERIERPDFLRKFNSARIARQAEKSLKAVFPGKTILVSDGRPVEIVYIDGNAQGLTELRMFKAIFSNIFGLKDSDLAISTAKKEAPAAAK